MGWGAGGSQDLPGLRNGTEPRFPRGGDAVPDLSARTAGAIGRGLPPSGPRAELPDSGHARPLGASIPLVSVFPESAHMHRVRGQIQGPGSPGTVTRIVTRGPHPPAGSAPGCPACRSCSFVGFSETRVTCSLRALGIQVQALKERDLLPPAPSGHRR